MSHSITAIVLGGAVLLDLLLGDSRRLPHPVVAIGKLTAALEQLSRRLIKPEGLAGFCAAILLIGIVLSIAFVLLFGVSFVENRTGLMIAGQAIAGPLLATLMIWVCLAARSMVDHSTFVCTALEQNDLADAREKTGWIVGRETKELNRDEIIRATIESVAESTVDGVTGVLFFATLGGLAGGWMGAALGALLFRSINTLDSMYGYRNERYLHFGRFAARLDDVAGFLPARLTPPVLVLTAYLLGENARGAWRIFLRDGSNHLSPNAGQCEAAFAGALDIQLGGTNVYHGKPVPKPTIGDAILPRTVEHIRRANRLLLAGSMMFALCAIGLFIVLDFLPPLF